LPLNYNPADYFIKILAVVPQEKEKCIDTINVRQKYLLFLNSTVKNEIAISKILKKICDGFQNSYYNSKMLTEIEENNMIFAPSPQNVALNNASINSVPVNSAPLYSPSVKTNL
jgi:hypothetical protein